MDNPESDNLCPVFVDRAVYVFLLGEKLHCGSGVYQCFGIDRLL